MQTTKDDPVKTTLLNFKTLIFKFKIYHKDVLCEMLFYGQKGRYTHRCIVEIDMTNALTS